MTDKKNIMTPEEEWDWKLKNSTPLDINDDRAKELMEKYVLVSLTDEEIKALPSGPSRKGRQ
jgi:hypothetical protein